MLRSFHLAVLGTLALAGQAHAAERVATFPANGRNPVAGPVPIGDEVAYGYRLSSGRWWIGTTARTLAVLPAPAAGMQANVDLEASPQRAAWVRTVEPIRQQRIPDPVVEDRLFSLRAPGAPVLVDDSCPPPGGCRFYGTSYHFAVDGPTMAWMRWPAPASPVTVDRGDGSPPTGIDNGDRDGTGPLHATGGRVAFETLDFGAPPERQARVTVADRDGHELLRVDSSPELTFRSGAWALLASGKLVIGARQGPVWLSPEEPTPHPIPGPHEEFFAILGAAGDRVVYNGSSLGAAAELRLLAVDGSRRTVARFPGHSREGVGFDGATVAWASRRCGVIGIWTAPADGSEAPWSDYTGSCPGFAARRPLVGRTRAVMRLQCPRGCRGSVSLALRDAPRKRISRRSVRFRPSLRERVVRLTLDRTDLRTLRKAGRFASPVVIQRFSGRDGTGEAVVAEKPRSVRFVR